MIALYLFAAIVGLPLVAYAVFAGDGDGEIGDVGDLGDAGEVGLEDGAILTYISLGTLAFFAGFFGLTGLATGLVGTGPVLTFVLAMTVGLLAAVAQRSIFNLVKGSSSSSHLVDADFSGRAGTVVVPIEAGKRGRIALQIGEQQQYLTAQMSSGEPAALDVGSPVVIIEVDHGVAIVAHLDPELA